MLGDGEPAAGPWHVEPVEEFARQLLGSAGSPAGRPAVVAVDGRSGSGKTTVSQRICAVVRQQLSSELMMSRGITQSLAGRICSSMAS